MKLPPANVNCTTHHVIKITRKDGLFDDTIGLTFGDVKHRFTETRFYSAHLAGMGDIGEIFDTFMEQTIPGEYDPQEYADLRYWIRYQI